MRFWLPSFGCLICLLICCTIVLVFRGPGFEVPEIKTGTHTETGVEPNSPNPESEILENLNIERELLLKRPLFDPKRGIVEQQEPEITTEQAVLTETLIEKPMALPTVEYIGFSVTDGAIKALILVDGTSEFWVRVGEAVSYWKINSINADEISISSASSTLRIKRSR